MKRNMIFMTAVLLICGLAVKAQTSTDSLAIEKACRDYVEGWAAGDADRVTRAVSPELVKRTVGQDKEGTSFTNTKYGFFDYCQLAKFNGDWKIINVLWGWLPKPGEK
jgi:hypothetical protein